MWFKSSFTTPAVAALSFCLIGGTSPAAADILHVPGDFPTIQEAIDAAMDGDEVEVHPGAYNEAIDFLGKAITVRSTDGPDVTTIDGTGNFHVVQCVSGEGSDTALDGFVITGGNADGDEFLETVGGGMLNDASSPTVTNCTFSDNSADRGGGMYNSNSSSSPSVTNCTFSGNTALAGGGMKAFNSSPTVTNCILWGDTPNEMSNDSSTPVVSYSDVQGGLPAGTIDGGGNIDADPLFVAPGIGDLRLMPGSPCIDAADNTAVPKGIDTDLDGNPRFVDDPDTDDTGFGDPPIVDMGAYEFQAMDCPWDVNGDGVVDHHDLVEVVHNLGQCDDDDNCPWDVNGDGVVNGRDIAAVATHFGPCP